MARKDKYGEKEPVEFPSSSARFTSSAIPIRTRKKYYGLMWRTLAIGLPILVIAILLLGFLQVMRFTNLNEQNVAQQERTYNPSFRVRFNDLGSSVIFSWYRQGAPVVDYADSIQWPGKELPDEPNLEEGEEDTSDDENTPEISNVTFISGRQLEAEMSDKVKDEYENPYEEVLQYYMVYNNQPVYVSIDLVVPDVDDLTSKPVLVSPPSLIPADQIGAKSDVSSNPEGAGMEEADLDDPAMSSLEDWGKAWAENDSNALKQIAQDDSDKVYSGLGAWSLVENSMSVNWAYETTFNDFEGRYVIAEVTYDIEQSVTRENEDGEPEVESFTSNQVMDVLISNADSSLPRIVSWGPAGTWSELEPYSVGEEPESDDPEPADPTEEPTDGPSEGPTDDPTDGETTAPPTKEGGK